MDRSVITAQSYGDPTNPHDDKPDDFRRGIILDDGKTTIIIETRRDLVTHPNSLEEQRVPWNESRIRFGTRLDDNYDAGCSIEEAERAQYMLEVAIAIAEELERYTDAQWQHSRKFLGRSTPDGLVIQAGGPQDGFTIAGPGLSPLIIVGPETLVET